MTSMRSEITECMPHLQRFAHALTGNPHDAEDLAHDCVVRALEKHRLFQHGTDLRAWMFTMMRNRFLDTKRREKTRTDAAVEIREIQPTRAAANQFDHRMLSETMDAMGNLNDRERDAILQLGIEGRSHAEVSHNSRTAVGTLKSRLSRGRANLRRELELMDGEA